MYEKSTSLNSKANLEATMRLISCKIEAVSIHLVSSSKKALLEEMVNEVILPLMNCYIF